MEASRFLGLREQAKAALLTLGGEERRIILEIAGRLCASRQLPDVRRIELLSNAELEAMLFGTGGVTEAEFMWRATMAHRARDAGPLPEAFSGSPDTAVDDEAVVGDLLSGWAASPGRIDGTVRVIDSLADGGVLEPGDILVAHATDPSWTPLFLIAGGVVLDAGGPLSHAAIVAREFGLPAVTNVRRATLTLRDGDHVEVDGTAGVVRRLDPVES
jgi:pyruvate,water dikinase